MAPTATPTPPPASNPTPSTSVAPPLDANAIAATAAAMGLPMSVVVAMARNPAPSPTAPPSAGSKRKATEPQPKSTSHALRGRSFLNHQQRLEIIMKRDEEPKWTQVQLARWAAVHFGLPKEPSQATIAVLLKKRDQLKAATVQPQTRTIRSPRHPALEAALLLWVRHLQTKKVPFTGENIRLKAATLASQLDLTTTLTFSTGWMSGFVSRHNLLLARAHKKKQIEGDEDEPVRAILKNYDMRNVFALYETALLYNDLPYDHNHDNDNKGESHRDRVCVGLAVNADASEKLAPLLVTTSRRTNGVFADSFFNVDGRMTARIYEQWLYKLNQRMVATHRKIVVVVSAAPSHFPTQLSHVKLVVLPPATTLRTHPLEGSVATSFKARYRKTHLSFAVDQAEEGCARVFDVSLSRALIWIKQAWLDVPLDLIRTCWHRTGLVAARIDSTPSSATDVDELHPEIVQSLVVSLSQLQFLETMPVESLLNAASEHDAHYVYDDATVVRIVNGEADGTKIAEQDDEADDVTDDFKFVPNETPLLPTEPHGIENETSTEELLANYRGVIWSLDVDPARTDEHQTVLRFLRRKQASLRFQQQQQQQIALSSQPPPDNDTHGTEPTVMESLPSNPPPSNTTPPAALAI